MRRLGIILILGLLMVLTASTLQAQLAQPSATLRVVDSIPFAGQELGSQADIVLFFNQPLNCDTA